MKLSEFAEQVAAREGGKKSIDIGQVKEVLRIVNDLTNGLLYVIVKWLAVLALMVSLGVRAEASGHHGSECAIGPVGPQGPAGETGATGAQGLQGVAGLNGLNGLNGRDGRDGRDAETHTRVLVGADVRLLDYEHMDLRVFDDYNVRDGRNDSVGVRVGFKVGKSYEERQMEKLVLGGAALMATMQAELGKRDAEIKRLDAEMRERDNTIRELKYAAHMPGVHQEHYYKEFNEGMRLYDKNGNLQQKIGGGR